MTCARRASAFAAAVLSVSALGAGHARADGCTGDLDGSGTVDGLDLGQLLSAWGAAGGDLTGDGTTDGMDLGQLLSNWGACPAPVEWTLVSQLTTNVTTAIDASGATVRTWTGAAQAASIGYLRADGSLVRPCVYAAGSLNSAGRGGRIQVFAPDGTLQHDLILASATSQQHHDVRPMPNGNILCIAWDTRTIAEQLAAGRTSATAVLWSEQIVELHPTGPSTYTVAWQWRVWDHLIQDTTPGIATYGVVADHPERIDLNYGPAASPVDWIHMNSIDYSPERDEIVVSSRSWSELWVIDHSTTTAQAASHAGGARGRGGDLLYRWGNPVASRRGTAADRTFYVCHSATFIDAGLPGAGNIMAFNNGDRTGAANDWSQVVELAPPRDADGNYVMPPTGPFGPTVPTWSVGGPGGFFGGPTQCGAFRTRANTTLITLTNSGTVLEVDSAGQVLSTQVLGGNVARVPRYRMVDGQWVGP